MLAILEEGRKEITVSNENIYQYVIDISMGVAKFEQIVALVKTNQCSF
jgi:hypothetical protein